MHGAIYLLEPALLYILRLLSSFVAFLLGEGLLEAQDNFLWVQSRGTHEEPMSK
jgi:hypothetical protein